MMWGVAWVDIAHTCMVEVEHEIDTQQQTNCMHTDSYNYQIWYKSHPNPTITELDMFLDLPGQSDATNR